MDLRFREALEGVWELVTTLNRTIDERKPWTLHAAGQTGELDALLYDLCEGLRWLAILLHPFMPERMSEMWRQLGNAGTNRRRLVVVAARLGRPRAAHADGARGVALPAARLS